MDFEENNILGERIRSLRKVTGLSQHDFAEKVFSSKTTVSLWERGEKIPSDDEIQRITSTFGISVEQFNSGEFLEMLNNSEVGLSVEEKMGVSVDELETAQKRITSAIDNLVIQTKQKVQQEERIKKAQKTVVFTLIAGFAIMILLFLAYLLFFNSPNKGGTLSEGSISLETSIFLEKGG